MNFRLFVQVISMQHNSILNSKGIDKSEHLISTMWPSTYYPIILLYQPSCNLFNHTFKIRFRLYLTFIFQALEKSILFLVPTYSC